MDHKRRSSQEIQRVFVGVLMGIACLPMVGCDSSADSTPVTFDPGVDLESRNMSRKMYTSKEDCLNEWGNDSALCEETTTTSPSGHSLVYYHGPYYSGSTVYMPYGNTYIPYQNGAHPSYSGFTGTRHSSMATRAASVPTKSAMSSAISRGGFGSYGARAGFSSGS